MRLYWDMNTELQMAINNAYRFATKVNKFLLCSEMNLYFKFGIDDEIAVLQNTFLVLF